MKNIITKAIWCLPLWGMFALIYQLSSIAVQHFDLRLTAVPDSDVAGFSQLLPSLMFVFWEKITSMLYFAGELALLFYVIERTNLIQAKYALLLLFIGQCFYFYSTGADPTSIFNFDLAQQMQPQEKDMLRLFLFSFQNKIAMAGFVGVLLAIPGMLLLWYSLFTSKLFPTLVNVLYAATILVYFGLTHYVLAQWDSSYSHYLWRGSLITDSVLGIIAGYAIATRTKFTEQAA